MRILTFTSLYPSSARPGHGIFVERRLTAIRNTGNVEARVVAPVPRVPLVGGLLSAYARYASVPRSEIRDGHCVLHPRYATVPLAGMFVQPFAMALGAFPAIARLKREFDFDLVDAHYFYPDAVAAAIIARRMGKPLVITSRGSDVNLLPRYAWPRKLILWAAHQAEAIVTVSAALESRLIELGVDSAKVSVIRNGVDTALFAPIDKVAARHRYGLPIDARVIVAVGNLVPEKAHNLLIDALAFLPATRLVVVGDGPERAALERRAKHANCHDRVTLLPAMPQHNLPSIYGAADIVALASMREGLPNVLLEAIACGRPVVASRVGGIPEIVNDPLQGVLVDDRSPRAFADAFQRVLANLPSPDSIRAFARARDWDATGRAQVALFERAIAAHAVEKRRALHHA